MLGCVIYSSAEMPRPWRRRELAIAPKKAAAAPNCGPLCPPCSVHGFESEGQPGPGVPAGLKALSVFQAGEQPGFPVAEGHSSVSNGAKHFSVKL